MADIFAYAYIVLASLYIVRCAAGLIDELNTESTKECKEHDQCPSDRACEAFRCVDPCEGHCGDNNECVVLEHIPFCGCKPGYTGTCVNCIKLPECETHEQCPADRACEAFQCIDPCEGWCGNNTFCEARHHLPNCQCSPGYIGNPVVNCFWPECAIHDDCPVSKSCVASKCLDPCSGRCGNNTECLIHEQLANCACKPGYIGNALVNCERLECEKHDQCLADRACVDFKCVDPCSGRCGNNTECLVHQHIANCACKPGYIGNALVNCDRVQKSYFIGDSKAIQFYEALKYCKDKGMRLATFDNKEEFNQLAHLIRSEHKDKEFFWVAGSDLDQRGVWKWLTTGRNITYLPWGPNMPDNKRKYRNKDTDYGEQHCVSVWYEDVTVYIDDYWCSRHKLYPICEK